MTRKTVTVSEAAHERLSALKREGESWTDLLERLADTVESQDRAVNADRTQVPDDVLTEDHLDDIESRAESAVESALEGLTHR